MFPHHSIHKFTWTSPDGKIHNRIDHIVIEFKYNNINNNVQYILPVPVSIFLVFFATILILGARGSIVVKALCYKLEGRGFDT
jgi:hypothetical protein